MHMFRRKHFYSSLIIVLCLVTIFGGAAAAGGALYASRNTSFDPASIFDLDDDLGDTPENVTTLIANDISFGEFDTSKMPEIDAEIYLLVESRSGVVICSKNADERLYPASITKIMTGILAIELGDPEQMMTASVAAVRDIGQDGGNIGIVAGESMRLDNLLDAMLVRSANETANIIAENLFDTRQEFIDLMNLRARQLNATSTQFTNTTGYHEESHYSTAADIARITRYAMRNREFRKYVIKPSILLNPTQQHPAWDRMANTNTLLRNESLTLMTITGVKTGFTTPSGYCIVASAEDQSGMELISIVFGVRGEGGGERRFTMALDLLKYGFNHFKTNTFVNEGEKVDTVSVRNGMSKDTVDAVSDGTIRLFLPIDNDLWNVSRVEYVRSEVTAPVSQGEVLGYIEYRLNGKLAGKVDVIAAEGIADRKGNISAPAPTPTNILLGRNITNNGGSSRSQASSSDQDGTSSNSGSTGNDSSDSADADPAGFPGTLIRSSLFQISVLVILTLAVIISSFRTIVSAMRARNRNRYYGTRSPSRSKTIKNYRRRSKWY